MSSSKLWQKISIGYNGNKSASSETLFAAADEFRVWDGLGVTSTPASKKYTSEDSRICIC